MDIEASISVSIPEPKENKTTFLVMHTRLPFVPPLKTTLTVKCEDEDAVPLIVDHIFFTLGDRIVYISTELPHVERILPDGRVQRVSEAETIEMLVASGGFAVEDVIEGDRNRDPTTRRRAPERKK